MEQEPLFSTPPPDADFLLFWKHYPRKQAQKDALKAWGQVRDGRPSTDELIAAVSAHCQSKQWREGIVPLPATWLRGERWKDSIPSDQRSPNGRPKAMTDEEIWNGGLS